MRRAVLAIALVTPACNQVFELDRPAPDAGSRIVVDYRLLVVTASGPSPPVVNETRVDMPTPRVRLDDDTVPSISVEADGTYSFERQPDQPYRVTLTTSLLTEVEFQLATPRLIAAERVIGRRAIADLPLVASILQTHPEEPMPTGGQSFLVTTGQWTETQGASPTLYSIDWRSVKPLGPPPVLFRVAEGDHAYGAYHGRRLAGTDEYTVVTDTCESTPQPDMVIDPNVDVTCTYAPVAMSRCARVTARRFAEDARLRTALVEGPAYFINAASWELLAVPSLALGRTPGLRLAYQAAGAGPTDFDGDVRYPTPYPGHGVSLGMRVERTRFIEAPDAAGTLVTASTTHHVTPGADCATPSVIPAVVGIPGGFQLGGMPLTEDAMISVDRTRDPTLTWTLAAPGPADYFVIRLGELTKGLFGETDHVVKQVYVTTDPRVRISRDLLAMGKTYVVEVEAQLGYPDASTGDLSTLAAADAPLASANNFSGVFHVVN